MPINILLAFLLGYLSSDKPFTYYFIGLVGLVISASYYVLVLLCNFPAKEDINQMTIIHVSVATLINDLICNFEFVTFCALSFKITDKRISAMHVTLLCVLNNMSQLVHKFYIFNVVDNFGIFWP
jgi:hypothetical protein